MRRNQNKVTNDKHDNGNGLIPNSFRFISSYIKTVSSNVRSAGASVSGSVSGDSSDELRKDQVLYSCFDQLELTPSTVKKVLLLGYSNGFQVLDVDNGSNFTELVSTRDDPVTFLQIQPKPEENKDDDGFKLSRPLLLVVASEETRVSGGQSYNERDEIQMENSSVYSPRAVRFYSLRSHSYVHVLRFRSTVYMVRCSPRIVAVGLASQIYCFDAHTLENKFSVLTYPISQLGGQGINIGYGPMAVGPRWLAYASNNPLVSNTGRLSPQNLSPNSGVSPSTSPGNGSLMARYAMESSKQLANGLIRAVAHSTENANAGMVVIKDFVSRAIISQFRAHTSPISALCFDPSGTLLVTASVHGNNINIFRILPNSSQNESGNQNFNWSSAHVHLYKLHRGLTSAVIQDICFSRYSQWIGVVSSRGTCHIYLLSPFGGETGIQLQNSKVNGSAPWWSTSSFMKDQSLSPPPPAAITLSVVSRIKNTNFGWINTVSGKTSVPAGVIAATFHSCVCNSNIETLEHLLVYTPSGFVIQYELLPSVGETSTSPQDEDLRVKVEPIQWWDVCRRIDWPEQQEFADVAGPTRHMSNSDDEDSKRQQRYLSHAEVQIRAGRVPVWQKSKIYFYVMGPQEINEVDIETVAVNEVEIRQKDLLPVFDSSRVFAAGRYPGSSDDKFSQGSPGSSVAAADLEEMEREASSKICYPILASTVNNNNSMNRTQISYPGLDERMNSVNNGPGNVVQSSESIVTSDNSNPGSNRSDLSMNIVDQLLPMHQDQDQEQDMFGNHGFNEDYCKSLTDEKSCKLGEINDVDNTHHQRNKSEEDDDMLGGVFDFSQD